MLAQLFRWKSYHHEFLVFGPSDQKRRPVLVLHTPSNSLVHVISAEPRMAFETELLGEANLLSGGSAVKLARIQDLAEAVIAQDQESRQSLRRLFQGIQERAASDEHSKPIQVYLGKVTTNRETLLYNPDSPTSFPPPRGYLL